MDYVFGLLWYRFGALRNDIGNVPGLLYCYRIIDIQKRVVHKAVRPFIGFTGALPINTKPFYNTNPEKVRGHEI